jgi:hypothetical protein
LLLLLLYYNGYHQPTTLLDLFLQVWCSQIGFCLKFVGLQYCLFSRISFSKCLLKLTSTQINYQGLFFVEVASLVRILTRYSSKWWWQVWMDYIDFFFSRFLLFFTTYLVVST